MDIAENIRYPIGRQEDQPISKEDFTESVKSSLLIDIKMLPTSLEMAILNLDADQLNTPYRPDGWTLNQLVHHVADSHMNAYVRFKLGLTENEPVIKPYDQDSWALLDDPNTVPINVSLTLLHALHTRWYTLMKSMTEEQWQRTIFHPEMKKPITLWELLKTYAWHGKHHVAQITSLRNRLNWY
ncbi:MAG: YfiT family bacillithiol transferase [Ginsengibacter sp.]